MSGKLFYANRIALPVEPPDRVLVVPWGDVKSNSGDFVVDREGADAMLAAFEEHGTDLPIDLEHATMGGEFATRDGSAPAVGWVKALDIQYGTGVWAEVEWTERGAEFIRAKEYRYLSPVVLVLKKNRRAVLVHSVALTNKPAIVGMVPIVNRELVVLNEEKFERTRWFLNLPETATTEAIMNELEKFLGQLRAAVGADDNANADGIATALKQRLDEAASLRAAVCKAVKLGDDAKADDIVAAINKVAAAKPAEPNPANFVPASELEKQQLANRELSDRVKSLEDELLANRTEAFLERGEKAGKIIASMRSMWERSYKADPKTAEEELKTAQVIAPAEGRIVNATGRSAPAAGGDAIVANADRFDPERMTDYEHIARHAKEKNCSFEEAMAACGAL